MKMEITGNLSKEEIEEILAKLREIEQRDPENKFVGVWLLLPEMTLKETEELILKFFPERKVAK